jgi:hypothetical protein
LAKSESGDVLSGLSSSADGPSEELRAIVGEAVALVG